jgi:hypothetical protein
LSGDSGSCDEEALVVGEDSCAVIAGAVPQTVAMATIVRSGRTKSDPPRDLSRLPERAPELFADWQ